MRICSFDPSALTQILKDQRINVKKMEKKKFKHCENDVFEDGKVGSVDTDSAEISRTFC